MRKYWHLLISAMFALGLTLTSTVISSARSASTGQQPPKLHAGVTIHVGDYWTAQKDDPNRAAMEKVAIAWEHQTHIHVVFDGPFGRDKFSTAAPAGQAPDLIGVPHDQIATLVLAKTLAPVPTWAWSSAQKKLYIKAAIQATTLNGKTYSMPWAIETTGIFYNKALVPSSTFKPARGKKYATWGQVIKEVQHLTDLSSNKFGLAWDITNFYYSYVLLSESGGYVFKYTKKGYDWHKLGLDTPGAIRGLQFLQNLTTAGKYKLIPSSMTYDVAAALFDAGKLGMFLTGPWAEASMQAKGINFGFAPVPSMDGLHRAHPFSGVQVFGVNAFSPHKNEAFAFLAYATRAMQVQEYKMAGTLPVLKSALNSKAVQRNAVASGLAQAAIGAQPMPNIPEMQQVWTPMADTLGVLVKGQATPSSAASAAVSQIRDAIVKAHGG